MKEHSWKLRRVEVHGPDRELQVERCSECEAGRVSLLTRLGQGRAQREIFTTDPDPMPEHCDLTQPSSSLQ